MSNEFSRPVVVTRREALGSMAMLAAAVEAGGIIRAAAATPPTAKSQDDPFGTVTSGGVADADITEIYPGIWRIHIGKNSERVTPLPFRSAPADTAAISQLPAVAKMPLNQRTMSWTLSTRGISVQFPINGEERIYGLGLDTEIFDMTDRRAICRPSDTPQDKMNYSHAPVPFYVSSRGYGLYVDTARYAWFYTGNVFPKADVSNTKNKTMMIDVHPSRGLDIYVFAGPTLRDAVQRYNLFSGGGAMPPLWGLGIHYRSESMMSAPEIVSLARRLREEKMPCNIWGLEPGWQKQTPTYSSSFVWDQGRFPDPDGFIKTLKAMNFHLNLWEHAFTNQVSPMFKALKPWSGNYLVNGGLVPDFATPQAQKIWAAHHKKIMFSKGIDGVKLDECDASPYRAHPWSFPEAGVFPSGMDGELMHSLFGVLYQKALLEPLTQRNTRTWSLVRETFALASPLPFVIYSDSYDFKCYLRGVCKQAFSGVMWVPEVRDTASVEELYRRVQMAIFAPVVLVNCWYMKLPPWLQINHALSNQGHLMSDHQAVTHVIRTLFELRMRLIPYLYAAFQQYRLCGMPPIRPMIMDWPADVHAHSIDDQFMFGPAILVAPIEPGQTERKVYLPAGRWYDFATHEQFPGEQWMTVRKPTEQVPMFVKSGTLLPLAEPMEYVAPETCFDITVHIFGSPVESISLYEDDGVSLDYLKGGQNRLEITWSDGHGEVKKTGGYSGPARYKIKAFNKI